MDRPSPDQISPDSQENPPAEASWLSPARTPDGRRHWQTCPKVMQWFLEKSSTVRICKKAFDQADCQSPAIRASVGRSGVGDVSEGQSQTPQVRRSSRLFRRRWLLLRLRKILARPPQRKGCQINNCQINNCQINNSWQITGHSGGSHVLAERAFSEGSSKSRISQDE